MTERTAARLAAGIALACFAMIGAALVLLYLNRATIGGGTPGSFGDFTPAVTLGALGALVASRRYKNPIGWLLLGLGTTAAISALGFHITLRGLLGGASPNGWVRWPAWVHNNATSSGMSPLIFVLLLFPDGKALSKRWRPVVWAAIVTSVGLAISGALDPTLVELSPRFPRLGNPVGVKAMSGAANSPLLLVLLVIFVLSAVELVLRLRRSRGEERQQLKWFVYAVAVSMGALIAGILLGGSPSTKTIADALLSASFGVGFAVAVPAAAAVAILRYGLYEIDVIITKTLVYFSLATFITVVYVGIVVGIGAVIGSKSNVGLSILATAVIAVAFQPARERSRRLADRLVYGKRATPYEVLSEFAGRIAGGYSLDDVLPRTARLLAEGTGAARADVWLKVGTELVGAGSWPEENEHERIPLADPENPEVPGTTGSVAVRHQGELLGALSVRKGPYDPITPAETKLLSDVASQAGLVLRNVGLIEELRASRQRLVAAQDEERRKIERNIHDGAQQQLVALAVKIRLASSLAEPTSRSQPILEQLGPDVADALENLRDLARGIYPPLLADKGLATALEGQARRSSIPVTVSADGASRYPQDTEAAVYFCCLEALQNVAKYAQASRASVGLTEDGHSLMFTVRDDGIGFDPATNDYGTGMQGMSDRLAAIGGELRVTSAPGEGTLIEGRVPIDTG